METVSYINPSSMPTALSRWARHGDYKSYGELRLPTYVLTLFTLLSVPLMFYYSVQPVAFNITLARTYRWQTENPNDQLDFLVSIIRLFRNITGGSIPLQIVGMRDPDAASCEYILPS